MPEYRVFVEDAAEHIESGATHFVLVTPFEIEPLTRMAEVTSLTIYKDAAGGVCQLRFVDFLMQKEVRVHNWPFYLRPVGGNE